MDRIGKSREEAARLRGQAVSEVTPSRRDFGQYVAAGKDQPAIIARLTKDEAATEAFVNRAVAYDDAEVAAISVSLFDGFMAADLAAISRAVTAPLLREDPLLDSNQLYHSRILGIDAIILPASALDADALARLVDVAVSMHMSVVVECETARHVEAALQWPYTIIGIADGTARRDLAENLPAARTIISLSAIATAEEYEAARGAYDAVVAAVGDDVGAFLRTLSG